MFVAEVLFDCHNRQSLETGCAHVIHDATVDE